MRSRIGLHRVQKTLCCGLLLAFSLLLVLGLVGQRHPYVRGHTTKVRAHTHHTQMEGLLLTRTCPRGMLPHLRRLARVIVPESLKLSRQCTWVWGELDAESLVFAAETHLFQRTLFDEVLLDDPSDISTFWHVLRPGVGKARIWQLHGTFQHLLGGLVGASVRNGVDHTILLRASLDYFVASEERLARYALGFSNQRPLFVSYESTASRRLPEALFLTLTSLWMQYRQDHLIVLLSCSLEKNCLEKTFGDNFVVHCANLSRWAEDTNIPHLGKLTSYLLGSGHYEWRGPKLGDLARWLVIDRFGGSYFDIDFYHHSRFACNTASRGTWFGAQSCQRSNKAAIDDGHGNPVFIPSGAFGFGGAKSALTQSVLRSAPHDFRDDSWACLGPAMSTKWFRYHYGTDPHKFGRPCIQRFKDVPKTKEFSILAQCKDVDVASGTCRKPAFNISGALHHLSYTLWRQPTHNNTILRNVGLLSFRGQFPCPTIANVSLTLEWHRTPRNIPQPDWKTRMKSI